MGHFRPYRPFPLIFSIYRLGLSSGPAPPPPRPRRSRSGSYRNFDAQLHFEPALLYRPTSHAIGCRRCAAPKRCAPHRRACAYGQAHFHKRHALAFTAGTGSHGHRQRFSRDGLITDRPRVLASFHELHRRGAFFFSSCMAKGRRLVAARFQMLSI